MTAFTYDGRRFDLRGVSDDDAIVARIRRKGTFYEVGLLEYVARVARARRAALAASGADADAGCVALDVGANIGNHTLYLRSFVVDHVLAFEPNPAVLPALRDNVAAHVDRCTVVAKALGAAPAGGRIDLAPENAGNVAMARVVVEPASGDAHGDGGNVVVSTLDGELDAWREAHPGVRPILVKIDVEGMELDVLEGARRLLGTLHPDLFVEAATPAHLAALVRHLEPYGYRAIGRWASTPVHHFCHAPGPRDRARVPFAKAASRLRALRRGRPARR